MACRIGMATDVAARVRQLKDEGTVPKEATWQTLKSGLDYREANEQEADLRAACGSHCQGRAGGEYKDGRVWSVYRVDW